MGSKGNVAASEIERPEWTGSLVIMWPLYTPANFYEYYKKGS